MGSMTTIDHAALSPLYALAATALLVLSVDLFLPGKSLLLKCLTAVGLGTTTILALRLTGSEERSTLCVENLCSYETNRGTTALTVVLCVITLFILTLISREISAEFLFLLLISLVGAVALVGARDWLTFFIALETFTLPTYVLTGLRRGRGALTLFVLSVVATAVVLLGIGLLYAAGQSLYFGGEASSVGVPVPAAFPAAAACLIVVGVLFKLAAVPWQTWPQAVYDDAPLSVVVYLATVSKLVGLVALGSAVFAGLMEYADAVGPIIGIVAVATMTLGNLSALQQNRIMRLFAFSSVAQAGFVIVPLGLVAAGSEQELLAGAWTYGLLVAFISVVALGGLRLAQVSSQELAAHRALARRQPWVGAALLVGLAGLAGLPPVLAGLWAKVEVFAAVVQPDISAWSVFLLLATAVNVVLGVGVYVRVARVLLRAPDESPNPTKPMLSESMRVDEGDGYRVSGESRIWAGAGISLATIAVLAIGVWPSPIFRYAQWIADAVIGS